jgi:hypothetical protein
MYSGSIMRANRYYNESCQQYMPTNKNTSAHFHQQTHRKKSSGASDESVQQKHIYRSARATKLIVFFHSFGDFFFVRKISKWLALHLPQD